MRNEPPSGGNPASAYVIGYMDAIEWVQSIIRETGPHYLADAIRARVKVAEIQKKAEARFAS